MEHRWNRRIATRTDVLLYQQRLPIATGKADNLSVAGMLVHPGPMELAKNTSLEVEFELTVDGNRRRFRLPALVVRRSQSGLGLMFRALSEQDAAALQRFVHEKLPPAQPGLAANSH